MRVYSVLDRAARAFGTLMFFANDAMARRGANDLMRSGGNSPIEQYPADFDLYVVGEFDQDSGVLTSLSPTLVCRFAEFVQSEVAPGGTESPNPVRNGALHHGRVAYAVEE